MIIKTENIFSLEGKVVVISGASGLLGRSFAEAVSIFNGRPILLDIKEGTARSLAQELNKKYSVDAIGFDIDITSEEQIEKNVIEVLNDCSKIDCLVNNAANNPDVNKDSKNEEFSRLENFKIESWEKDIKVGLTGSFLCSKHYGNAISRTSKNGSIVNISSDLGLISPDQRLYVKKGLRDENQPVKPVSYSVTKSGINGLTKYLATYWLKEGVRCNAICPGGVRNNQSDNFISEIEKRIPLGRMAEINDYQGTLVWMLSDASRYLNGAIVPVDGGRTSW